MSRPALSNDFLYIRNTCITVGNNEQLLSLELKASFALWEDHFYISPPHVSNPLKTGALVEVVHDNIMSTKPMLSEHHSIQCHAFILNHILQFMMQCKIRLKLSQMETVMSRYHRNIQKTCIYMVRLISRHSWHTIALYDRGWHALYDRSWHTIVSYDRSWHTDPASLARDNMIEVGTQYILFSGVDQVRSILNSPLHFHIYNSMI